MLDQRLEEYLEEGDIVGGSFDIVVGMLICMCLNEGFGTWSLLLNGEGDYVRN